MGIELLPILKGRKASFFPSGVLAGKASSNAFGC